jgi:hypothetical protein
MKTNPPLNQVSIFFLPLTFVTSIFGMSNMPDDHWSKTFGITMATVCVPFFLLIGFLNTTSGMEIFREKWHKFVAWARRDRVVGNKPELDTIGPGTSSLVMFANIQTLADLMQGIQE